VTNIITNNNINTFIINDPNIAANGGNPAALQNLTQAAMSGAASSTNQQTTTTTTTVVQGGSSGVPTTTTIHPS